MVPDKDPLTAPEQVEELVYELTADTVTDEACPVTALPFASTTVTTGTVVNTEPAVGEVPGEVVNESAEADPGEAVIAVLPQRLIDPVVYFR